MCSHDYRPIYLSMLFLSMICYCCFPCLDFFVIFCSLEVLCGPDGELPEKLRNLEPRLIEHISNEIMDQDPNVRWEDIGIYS